MQALTGAAERHVCMVLAIKGPSNAVFSHINAMYSWQLDILGPSSAVFSHIVQ
jgi:hypothetical protein